MKLDRVLAKELRAIFVNGEDITAATFASGEAQLRGALNEKTNIAPIDVALSMSNTGRINVKVMASFTLDELFTYEEIEKKGK